jgi:4-alpha-glucanotransferase
VLPLGPTGWGDSPYQSLSAFAGNPLWISLEHLVEEGLLAPADLDGAPTFPADEVDYERVAAFRMPLLRLSFDRFHARQPSHLVEEWERFCQEQAGWLDDWARFIALKEAHGGAAWTRWERELTRRNPAALSESLKRLAEEVHYHRYLQYLFFRQWHALKGYANQRGVQILGDVPLYVAHDSADVWANPQLFLLDERGEPTVVSGVPPDYFSKTGQRWGTPIYRWQEMASSGYRWWVERFGWAFRNLDLVVLDHFRGFEGYWEVPASSSTAAEGRWVEGPGASLFDALQRALGLEALPCIAEDLGVITPPVEALRDRFGFPGMRVLQFAFDGTPQNPHLPHNYPQACVVYTGTHNNDTTVGWFRSLGTRNPVRRNMLRSLGPGAKPSRIHWHLVQMALASVAQIAIIPWQDVLGLGSEARTNRPGVAAGNWRWRWSPGPGDEEALQQLRDLTYLYGRAS